MPDVLDILCENDLTAACADRFILGSSPRASNDSIDYWIKAGEHFPFPMSSHIKLTTAVQRNSTVMDTQLVSITYAALAAVVVHKFDKFSVVPAGLFLIIGCYTVVILHVLTGDQTSTGVPDNMTLSNWTDDSTLFSYDGSTTGFPFYES
ncbi:unnamed protein product [Nippostrongylus brasiliensis]|uniref:Transmembrane protein n=1 Tax=Nippostrongylus brasiliensis TaxID=27835 RepID=A0A0N4YN65_NIPBR|nr:unnamed protein product [Nippostrongylus brasiliensis]